MQYIDHLKEEISLIAFIQDYQFEGSIAKINDKEIVLMKSLDTCLMVGLDKENPSIQVYQNVAEPEDKGTLFNFILNRPELIYDSNEYKSHGSIVEGMTHLLQDFIKENKANKEQVKELEKELTVLDFDNLPVYWDNQTEEVADPSSNQIVMELPIKGIPDYFKNSVSQLVDNQDYLAFPLHNATNQYSGLYISNEKGDYFDPFTNPKQVLWHSDLNIATDIAVIVNTPLEAIEHYGLHGSTFKKPIHYFAIFQDTSKEKVDVLKSFLERHVYRHIYLCGGEGLESITSDFSLLSHLNNQFLKGEISYKNELQISYSFFPSKNLASKALTLAFKAKNEAFIESMKARFEHKDNSLLKYNLIYLVRKNAEEFEIIAPNNQETIEFLGKQIIKALKIKQHYYIGEKQGVVKEIKKTI